MKQVKKDDHCQGIHVQINWVNKMLVDELHKNDKIRNMNRNIIKAIQEKYSCECLQK
jgi:uncharacterized iron-regulated protein